MTATIPAAVLGATGYVGGELLRLIAAHPAFALAAAVSTSRASEPVGAVFPSLAPACPDTRFCAPEDLAALCRDTDRLALFSAAPHGASATLVAGLAETAESAGVELHVVDVSADFRYPSAAAFEAVYGEAHGAPALLGKFTCSVPEHVDGTPMPHVGHPGCFATAALLAAVPLCRSLEGLEQVFIAGITGSTGSGRSPAAGTHHPERHSNLYAYKPLLHRHVPEIKNGIAAAGGGDVAVAFVPHSGPFARGIHVTLQARLPRRITADTLADLYRAYYGDAAFVRVVDGTPRLKDVATSNYCRIGVAADGETAAITCVIDNLVKGAAGGAVQWMNRLWGLPEETGLMQPAPAWT